MCKAMQTGVVKNLGQLMDTVCGFSVWVSGGFGFKKAIMCCNVDVPGRIYGSGDVKT